MGSNIAVIFSWFRVIALALACAASFTQSTSAAPPSDEELRKAIVGNWTIGPEDSAYPLSQRAKLYALSQYNADGSGLAIFYRGKCGVVIFRSPAPWKILHGILIQNVTEFGKNKTYHDRIVEVQQNSLKLISLDDGKIGQLQRTELCAAS